MTVSPAVEVARNGHHKEGLNEPITLSTGYVVRLKPVAAVLIQEAQAKIKEPVVPTQKLDDGRTTENPQHPDYIQAQRMAYLARAQAGIDTMVLFGVELPEGLPEDEGWLKKLRFMEKRGLLDLSEYDLDEPLEREFIFKKFIAMGNDDWELLGEISGIDAEAVARAKASFPGT